MELLNVALNRLDFRLWKTGIPFKSVIVEVSPQEFSQLKAEPFVSFRSERWTIGPRLAAR